MDKRVWNVSSWPEMEQAVKDIYQILQPANGAVVLALHGDLGSGKTSFAQLLARELGIADTVNSPTFVIMKKYETTNVVWRNFIHIDAYRLDSEIELQVLGFENELQQADNLICIEWAEKVSGLIPITALNLYFKLEKDNRTITLQ